MYGRMIIRPYPHPPMADFGRARPSRHSTPEYKYLLKRSIIGDCPPVPPSSQVGDIQGIAVGGKPHVEKSTRPGAERFRLSCAATATAAVLVVLAVFALTGRPAATLVAAAGSAFRAHQVI